MNIESIRIKSGNISKAQNCFIDILQLHENENINNQNDKLRVKIVKSNSLSFKEHKIDALFLNIIEIDNLKKNLNAWQKKHPNIIHTINKVDGTLEIQTKWNITHYIVENNNNIKRTKSELTIDHIAICILPGELKVISSFYKILMNLNQAENFHIDDMNMSVHKNPKYHTSFVLIEPVDIVKPTHLSKFYKFNNTGGIQHIAFETKNLKSIIENLTLKGMKFLPLSNDSDNKKIVYTKQSDGYLAQCFTKEIDDDSGLFFEFIERKDFVGLHYDNIKSLFSMKEESI